MCKIPRRSTKNTVAEYRAEFESLSAPLPELSKNLLDGTFLNGLKDEVRTEVLCFDPIGLEAMMKAAQRIEDKISAH